MAPDPPPLFVYGTLLFPPVLEALVERVPASRAARITGWRAAALPGRVYPGLVPARGAVDGRILLDLRPHERQVIHEFEGELYDLRELALDGGDRAMAYVWRAAAEILSHDWDPDHFAAHHLARFAR